MLEPDFPCLPGDTRPHTAPPGPPTGVLPGQRPDQPGSNPVSMSSRPQPWPLAGTQEPSPWPMLSGGAITAHFLSSAMMLCACLPWAVAGHDLIMRT